MNKGFVYVLSNPYHKKGIYKIGLTTRTVEERIGELNRATGVVGKFKEEFSIYTDDCHKLEKLAHKHFAKDRCENNREFFNTLLEDIKYFLECGDVKRDTYITTKSKMSPKLKSEINAMIRSGVKKINKAKEKKKI